MVDLASVPALGTTPVSDDLPGGESLRYDPDYEAVSAELAKLGTPDASSIDWKLVTNRSASLLERTKDLVLATAMTHGLLMTQGMEGYAAGLTAINGMVSNFWAGLHPNRMRARASAFSWMSERADAFFADPANAGALDPAQVVAAANTADELFSACSAEKMEGEDSGLGGLVRSLREARDRVGGGASASGDGSSSDGSSSDSSTSSGGSSMTISIPSGGAALNPAGVIATRDEAFRRLAELAEFFVKAEPLSPVGHLLKHASNWSRLTYVELYAELLSSDAQTTLLQALGIKRDDGSSSS